MVIHSRFQQYRARPCKGIHRIALHYSSVCVFGAHLQVSFTDRMVEPGMMLSINDIANEPRVEITDLKKEAMYSFIMVRQHSHQAAVGASSEG